MVADILVGFVGHVFAVDAQNDVAFLQACFGGGHTFVGLVYHYALLLKVVADDGAHARILARHHLLIFGSLVFGIVGGVGVEAM